MNRPRTPTRESIAVRLPYPFLAFPFEVLIGTATLISGLPILFGQSTTITLTRFLPEWAQLAWGVIAVLGGGTILSGLYRKAYTTAVPRGLRLVGCSLTVYALAIIFNADDHWNAVLGTSVVIMYAVLCGFRSFHLRAVGEIVERATRWER